jgi:DNA-binding NarL/FixJ family response regulator
MVREGISALLDQVPEFKVVASGPSSNSSLLLHVNPRVILLDLGLRHENSLHAATRLKYELPDARIILMDLLPSHEEILPFVNVGVAGFLMKDATLEDLINTVRNVAGGANILPPEMTGTLFTRIARDALARGHPETLASVRITPREREVVNLISEGLSNKEIAERLGIAPYTVRSHVHNLMEKLMLHTRLQIAAYAHRDGTH